MADDNFKFNKEMSDEELDSITGGRGIQELAHGRKMSPVGRSKGPKVQPAEGAAPDNVRGGPF